MDLQALDARRYCLENRIRDLFGGDADTLSFEKKARSPHANVAPHDSTPLPVELDDLVRLHYLVRTRRVTTILEFGSGRSTLALADAIEHNRREFGDHVARHLRRSNPFELHSVDASRHWINVTRAQLPAHLRPRVTFHQSAVSMTTFNGRACTLYDRLPNICPDFIYLDAPDQYSVSGDVHGVSTAHPDRLPMSADILLLEPFLLPGTLIVVDGRTANARFLKHNLQGVWWYEHHIQEDVHTLELVEPPLGVYNERQIRFCLGDDWPGLLPLNVSRVTGAA